MYNRYIPNGASYTRIPEEEAREAPPWRLLSRNARNTGRS